MARTPVNTDDIFPAMQDDSGLNLEAVAIQQGMMRATGQPPSAFSGLAPLRNLIRATGDGDEIDPMTMAF